MKPLPDKHKALETLRSTGYVRVGDHSATSEATLDEVYSSRHEAWEEAERRGFVPGEPHPASASAKPKG